MKTEQIKAKINDAIHRKTYIAAFEFKKIKKDCFKNLKKALFEMDRKSEAGIWLAENYDFLCSLIAGIQSSDLKVRKSFFDSLKNILKENDFQGEKEEFLSILSSFSEADELDEKELQGMQSAVLLSLFCLISESLFDRKEDLVRLIRLAHKIKETDFSSIAFLFSPLEKLLRQDPDGTYPKMTRLTQQLYKAAIHKEAKRRKVTPRKVCREFLNQAQKEKTHVGFFLPKPKNKILYYPIVFLFAIFLLIPFWYSIKNLTLFIFSVLPIYFFAKALVDFSYSRITKSNPLPALRMDRITENEKTAVVITSLITSEKDVEELLKKIAVIQINNGDQNDQIYFGLVCDLLQSKKKTEKKDQALISCLKKGIENLNEKSPVFFACLRHRVYHKSEDAYAGWERKRGAIEQAIDFFKEGKIPSGMEFFGQSGVIGSKFMITLDGDTELGIGQAKRLVGIHMHPLNRPVLEKRGKNVIVKSGFGILQPKITGSLLHPIKTPFAKIISNGSGQILYASASFDLMQSLFGVGNFCGKGIIDVEAYYKVMKKALPEQKILSHDMPEGALLRSALVNNEFFVDSDPQSVISFYKRLHRWIRGDVQNIAVIPRLNFLRKWFAIENLLRYLLPISEFFLLFLSNFIGKKEAVLCGLIIILFHFQSFLISSISNLICGEFYIFQRRFATKIRNLILNAFYQSLISIASIAFETIYFADAILRSVYRMLISKKRLLEWQVYSPFSSKNSDLLFFLPSILVSAAFLFFTKSYVCLCLALSWLFYPLAMLYLSLPYQREERIGEKEKESLRNMAKNEFLFFKHVVNEKTSFLPPDNIQFQPIEKIAMRTSPTNIGLYLSSLIAAKDFNFISEKEAIVLLEKAMLSIEKLERYKGHLYNWYDLNTLGVIGEGFVSTVDSGNYFAALITVRNALSEFDSSDPRVLHLMESIDRQINSVDFTALFDYEKNLFFVGVFPENPSVKTSHYDLYMSEARITSFLAIALGQISAAHWKKLERPLLSFYGRTGAASWTGTAFEYFMAPLFLPIIKNSFEDESLEFAYFCQKKYTANAAQNIQVFGISESGYTLVDEKGNLQYKAFGVPFLSVRSKENYPKVISPYSSFLMVEKGSKTILENLQNLSALGMCGPFGFYEAVEFGSNFLDDYSIVYSYMSHHKGMSIIALCNAVFDQIFTKRFLNYANFKAKESLLAERFPIEAKVTKKKKAVEKKSASSSKEGLEILDFSSDQKNAKVITDGKSTFLCFDNGQNRFFLGETDVFDPLKGGLSWKIITSQKIYCVSEEFKDKIKVFFGLDFAEYTLIDGAVSITVHFELISGQQALLVRLETSGIPGEAKIEFEFDLILQNENKFVAHPAFQLLSLEGKSSGEKLIFRRRGERENEYLSLSSPSHFKTLFSSSKAEKTFSYKMLYDSKVRIEFEQTEAQNLKLPLIFSYSKSEDFPDLISLLDGSYNLKEPYRSKGSDRMNRLHQISFYRSSCKEIESKILCQIFSKRRFLMSCDPFEDSVHQDFLWRHGISGDFPIVLIFIKEKSKKKMDMVRDSIRVLKKLKIAGFSFDLVILHEGKAGYFDPIRDEFSDMISENKCEFLIGKNGGLHFIACEDEREFRCFSYLAKLILGEEDEAALAEEKEFIVEPGILEFGENGEEMVGSFLENGFVIDKKKYSPSVPFSHIVSNRVIGFACDQNSLGFTWFRNAGLNRLSKWENLPDFSTGEKIYLELEGKFYDLIQSAERVEYRDHIAVHSGELFGEEFRIFSTVSSFLSAKTIYVFLSEKLNRGSKLHFSFIPSLGKGSNRNILLTKLDLNFYSFAPSIYTEYHTGGYLFVKDSEAECCKRKDRLDFSFKSREENTIVFGGFSSKKHLEFLMSECKEIDEETILLKEKQFSSSLLDPKKCRGEAFWPYYQAVFSRFFGRTGVFQSSGAFGFRDQLQDCLIFLDQNPQITKQHILRSASHQFSEGDVMHWWHPNKMQNGTNSGIRSRCSDDYLWLLFVVSEYIEKTSDFEILNLKAPFLSAEALKAEETERYLIAEFAEKGTLLEHMKRAAARFISRGLGPNSLPYIGSGDWNDGMNEVTGESVWLGFFGAICLNRTKRYFDPSFSMKIDEFLVKLSTGINSAFNGGWFVRAFRENGQILGNDRSVESECSIDLITQAFSAFYYLEMKNTFYALDDQVVRKALINAFYLLSDEKASVIRLFRKPFVNTEPSPGYIQRYVAGVRENGGQYTHAAVWFALALLEFGLEQNDEELIRLAKKCKELIDPRKNIEAKRFLVYQREPYVLCGDVYDASGFRGRGGWSWYTGAAGWYYRLFQALEELEKDKNIKSN